ncbi:MAG: cyclic nucleotide-binding domain-containing protein [Deltaproteobacteria bacterium]|uniref:Crp/Fnr family transcriptional regulator n=1 Tax=Desulfobacula sp. TaxID=2593537 RepID=UPI0019BF5D39|nr:cyclic nucleotide-binding domain-containing protein [Candidatus Desulfobacula maris]MBL6994909.1 cyclic nucleotide-binding domain-containing protein [Desulfobacula sp.]
MSIDSHILKPLDFFVDFKQHELETCAAALKSRTVAAGEVIIERGTPALTFFFILSGAYEVAFEGDRSIILEQKGEVMGWSTVIRPFHYTGTITAQKDGEVLEISSSDFFELIQGDNALGEKIMKKINKIASERRTIAAGSQ